MKTLLALSLLTLLAGCDAPQRTRAPVTYVNGNNYSGTATTGTSGFSNGTTTTTTGTTTGTPNPVTSEAGFSNCDLSDKYQTIDIGFFGLCQSTQDETVFKFRTSLAQASVRVCLIPTYKDQSGSSTYIGQPQCTYTQSNAVISGKLYKDRPGFSNYPLNGVIVMKEPLLTEYFGCMQAYTSWPANVCSNSANAQYCAYWQPRCPYGGQTNVSCDTEGRNYMAVTCNNFKSKYTNSYIDIRLKN